MNIENCRINYIKTKQSWRLYIRVLGMRVKRKRGSQGKKEKYTDSHECGFLGENFTR